MPRVSGFLRFGRGHPDHDLPGGGHIDNSLPGLGGPTDPGYGMDMGGSIDNDLPRPPPGVWPPPSAAHPIVPAPPGTPPGAIWPPIGRPPSWTGGVVGGGHPSQGLPGRPTRPDQGLPGRPARPDQGLPPSGGHPSQGLPGGGGGGTLPVQTYWLVAGIPGVGWRYVAVDPSQ